MVGRKFEIIKNIISYKTITKKIVTEVVVGSFISVWVFIILNYLETISIKGTYSSPFTIIEYHFLCIPLLGYNLPAYFFVIFIYTYLINNKLLKLNFLTYIVAGILSHLVGASLFFISSITYDSQSLFSSLVIGIPTLVIYFLFFNKIKKEIQ